MQTKKEQTTLLQNVIEGIQEKKGKNIVIVDLTGIIGCICNQFVICEGNSPNQVSAIADSVREYVRKKISVKPVSVSGEQNAQWIAMDYSDIIVHIFLPDRRNYYQLEHLWNDAKLTDIPDLD
ncbi:MAG: ribosome silencing factor [Bacteroidales bacterium]|jgi:ribosome-associated protein|nr:ribosome silencing factor [Bacteroidales bacterium]